MNANSQSISSSVVVFFPGAGSVSVFSLALSTFSVCRAVGLDKLRCFELVEQLKYKLSTADFEFQSFDYYLLRFLLVVEADDCHAHFLACGGIHKDIYVFHTAVLIEQIS